MPRQPLSRSCHRSRTSDTGSEPLSVAFSTVAAATACEVAKATPEENSGSTKNAASPIRIQRSSKLVNRSLIIE